MKIKQITKALTASFLLMMCAIVSADQRIKEGVEDVEDSLHHFDQFDSVKREPIKDATKNQNS